MLIKDEFLLPADDYGREAMEKKATEESAEILKTSIGKSILGREITSYVIGEGKRVAVYVGCHHALESLGSNLLYLMLYALGNKREFTRLAVGVDREIFLKIYKLVIIPCLNPDGVELRLHGAKNSPLKERQLKMSGGDFSSWQSNARGVDLNHNYDSGFYEYKKTEAEKGILPGATLYSGEYPESEPETKALGGVIRALQPSLTVSLHSQGEEIYHSKVASRLAKALCAKTGYKTVKAFGTAAYGGLTDYLDRVGLAALTLEIGKGTNPLPQSDLPLIAERLLAPLIALPTLV